jgi:hypothetical protein
MSYILVPEHLGWTPKSDIFIVYSADDIVLFRDTVCEKIGLYTLKKAIDHFGCDHNSLKRLIATIARDRTYEWDGLRVTCDSKEAQEYHQKLYKLMYEIPFEDTPLYINEEDVFLPVIKWRLMISK